MPNALAPVIVTSTISLGIFIVAESTLSFLGIGLPATRVRGAATSATPRSRFARAPHLVVMWVPATALAITVLGFIMLGEALRDALDPKARKS